MNDLLHNLLRCPVTRSKLRLKAISRSLKNYNETEEDIVTEGILFADEDWFYPIINGIPRLIVESFIDYEDFFLKHLPDYRERRKKLFQKYEPLIDLVCEKNRRTKKSFSLEWQLFDYDKDKTWNEKSAGLLDRFLIETNESKDSLKTKLIFDAGCGNGLLNQKIAEQGTVILGMDFSKSIERAYLHNKERTALFIQGDVQFPPVIFEEFDIVHSSGVLICTNNTELSFSCISPCVKPGGKLSVWLYAPRKDFIHNMFNFLRRFTSKLPIQIQYYIYLITLFPISFIIKRLKGNKQNAREIMVTILDWFSPEFRWEHSTQEATSWFHKRQFNAIQITTSDIFGFNIIGTRNDIGINNTFRK